MTAARYYVDTTVFLAAAGPTHHPNHAACAALMSAVAEERITAHICTETLVECLHAAAWHQARSHGLQLLPLLQTLFPQPITLTAAMIESSVDLLSKYPRLGIRTALHASTALAAGCHEIISLTPDYGMIAGIRRWEPAQIVDGQRSRAR
jgi:predicted nucleic acid-binding protein